MRLCMQRCTALSGRQWAEDIQCEAPEFLTLQVSTATCRLSVVEDISHSTVDLLFINVVWALFVSVGIIWALAREKKEDSGFKLTQYIYIYIHTVYCLPFVSVLIRSTELAAHCLCCALLFKLIHQAKTDLETKAYIVAYILPYSALFDILHL